ncbi:MAG: 30S ribosomal protein S6 [Candidatus Pacebacteria bacterium]|nr:30S ribosomal protein S6 [Candidatus Paceibacterota bacterium]
MKLYELTLLISPNVSEEELSKTIQDLRVFISDSQGEIKTEISAMPIKLDYPVNGFSTAYMASFDLNFIPEKVIDLMKFIENDKLIINHIIFAKKISPPRPERGAFRKKAIEKAEETIAQVEEEQPIKEKKVELESLGQKLDEILGEE